MRVALLGCGRIGRMHATNLQRHADTSLAMVYDVYGPSAEALGEQAGVSVAASPDAVFDANDVDAVLIASTTDTHADYIERAVATGKPVLCEKPIDLDIARVRLCASRIADSGVPIQLGFNRRFDPGHRAARDSAAAGIIGDIHQVVITSRDPGMPPRSYYESAGGLLRDMTIHDFDLARFALGEEPVEVFAVGGQLIDPELMHELDDLDSTMIIMRTASGKQCHINNSRTSAYGYDQRLEILGTTGMVLSDNRKPHAVRHYSSIATESAAPYLDFFIERYEAAFMAELGAFVEAVANRTEPEVGFDDGVKALELAEAAYLSITERRLVRVDEIAAVSTLRC